MSISHGCEDKDLIRHIYRKRYPDFVLSFDDILKDALRSTVTADDVEIERLTDAKKKNVWRILNREIVQDLNNHIVPVFDIVDIGSRQIRWIGLSCSGIHNNNRYHYTVRPTLYRLIDELTDRQYEALACVICKMFGAQNVMLTAAGNEGGIDFFASISFSNSAHYLFGTKGPLRIVGQCKKYSSRDNVGHMKEFVQTLESVYNQSYRAGEILPHWFKATSGPIIGWHIANIGHQSGASDIAKNFGIITSNTKELIDLICKLKIPYNVDDKISYITTEIQHFIDVPEQVF